MRISSIGQNGAFTLGLGHLLGKATELFLVDHWTNSRLWVSRITNNEIAHTLDEHGSEFIIDRVFNDDPIYGHADLALM
ncbi:hypothetical protein D3C87_1884940 [compost metagenome]